MDTNHTFLQAGAQPVSDRMRELLARAAQDHVYDQRSQGQVLDEIRQRLEGLEWLLREVRERELGDMTGQLENVRDQVEVYAGAPPEWARGLAEHLGVVAERIKPVGELPSVWADVSIVAEHMDEALSRLQTVVEFANQVTEATQQATRRTDELFKRLDKLQGSMEAASVRFNRIDKSLAELGHRAEKLEHQVNSVSGRSDQSLNELAERFELGLEAVNGRVEGVGGRLDGVDGRLDGIDGRFTGVSGKLDGIDGRFDGIDGRFEGVDDRIDVVNERIGQLPVALDVGDLHRKLGELASRPVHDPTGRFDALDKRLTETVTPLVDELRARPDRVQFEETISKIVTTAHSDVTKRVDVMGDEVRKRVDGVHENVTRRVEIANEAVTQRVENASEAVAKRVENVQEDVRKTMGAAHDDMLKRLATLEETMIALAEALLRPRAEGKE